MKICGEYDVEMNEKNFVDSYYGEIFMSVSNLYSYFANYRDIQENIIWIAWLPSIKEIHISSYEQLDITFENNEKVSLYDLEFANYLTKCIANEYK